VGNISGKIPNPGPLPPPGLQFVGPESIGMHQFGARRGVWNAERGWGSVPDDSALPEEKTALAAPSP
jgi:hypothetical protein